MTDQNIIQDFDEAYNDAYFTWNSYYPEAELDLRWFLGDQWNEKEKTKLFDEGRNAFVFNRIFRNINMITGYQIQNRLSSVIVPVEDSDQLTADQFTKVLLNVMNHSNGYKTISNCFAGAIKTGWNLMSIWMDYRDDPVNGDIKFTRIPFNGFITDPYFSNLDFSDCNYIMMRKYLSPEQAISLIPDRKKDILSLYRVGWSRDEKFTWLPYQRQANGQDLMAYNEYYLQKWKNVPVLVDMETGQTIDFDVPEDRMGMILSQYPQLKVIQKPQRYIEKHIILNDQVMSTENNPYGLDEYPFAPFACVWEPESDQWGQKMQSLVRFMRDPQKESNKRRSQMADLLDSQINSGWIAKENSVVNPRSLFQSGQGKVIWKREDAQPDALEKLPPAQIPPSMFQLQELFDRDIMEIVGINDANFGITENGQESGVMMMLRQGASVVNLQGIMDNLREAQKCISKKALKLIQKWTPQKIQRIINEEPSQQFYAEEFTKYDVEVVEGMLTATQRQIYFRQLTDLKQLGVPITGEMLAKAAPIQGKSKLDEEIAQMEKQQAEQAQQAQQIQMQQLDSERQASQAKAISDIALSKERFTRAVANMGLQEERNSEAIQNRAQASLDKVKAIKELESMDDNQLVKYMGIIRMMDEMNKQEEEKNKAEDVLITEKSEQLNAAFPKVEQTPPPSGMPDQSAVGAAPV